MTFLIVFLILLFVPGVGTMLILWFPGKPETAVLKTVRPPVKPQSKFILLEMPSASDHDSWKAHYRIVESHPVIRDSIVREYTVRDRGPVTLFRRRLGAGHAGLG